MIKEWATVISWQAGSALLRCEPRSGCSSCQTRTSCGTGLLSGNDGDSVMHQLWVPYSQPLLPGQRVEIGLAETSLLRSAMLVYLVPLLGLLAGAGGMQFWLNSEPASVFGAFFGAAVSFMAIHRMSSRMGNDRRYQPVILQVALPESVLRASVTP
ncbi:SoxR-reducing system protein RseC [Musicola paradisiaca]|uniref:Positive regulator of sigma E, RseC/MucC n=1 Tax=Musicola paradisiaca (strain Ech703) TaxID=579405 RepID=C6CAR7_MUSP7|nr:SoxR-reducing system protein RseC [Musicola paradisiaca]ACS86565.1 positive regulator of sigma E, RseC/MucC [Musicola paradisiaca Ech703]